MVPTCNCFTQLICKTCLEECVHKSACFCFWQYVHGHLAPGAAPIGFCSWSAHSRLFGGNLPLGLGLGLVLLPHHQSYHPSSPSSLCPQSLIFPSVPFFHPYCWQKQVLCQWKSPLGQTQEIKDSKHIGKSILFHGFLQSNCFGFCRVPGISWSLLTPVGAG